MQSRFTVECDIGTKHQQIFGRAPDFKLYYGLAHYHTLATKLTVEAITDTGAVTTAYSTEHKPGDTLGGPIDPQFSMSGFTKLRMTCEYYNPRADVVSWGNGDQEMCVFLGFSDSSYNWGGGVLTDAPPENPAMVGNEMTYTNACTVFANDASR
jgi:hypothetical protein